MLDRITPLLITLDEEPNIERTLAALAWAREIVVVDSGSTDGTLELLRLDPRVRVVTREFDTFAGQLTFGLNETSISTDWVLALDADHVPTPALVEEMSDLEPEAATSGYRAEFSYCIQGRRLRGSLYPSRVVLFRRQRGSFEDDGHGHRVVVEGRTERLEGRILHDDRKPLSRWLGSQAAYSRAEASKLLSTPLRDLSRIDRLRLPGFLAPLLVVPYCLIVKRGVLDGRAGWSYAFQRAVAEALLAIRLLEHALAKAKS